MINMAEKTKKTGKRKGSDYVPALSTQIILGIVLLIAIILVVLPAIKRVGVDAKWITETIMERVRRLFGI